MSPPPTKSVLLVDNDFGFLILAMDAIRATTSVAIAFQIALDGAEAINYLRGEVEYTDRARYPLPDLVLSQMNLTGMSGLDLLAWIKRQPQFQDLPVILMYSEQDAVSADEAQQLGASLILSKPVSPQSSYDFSKQVLDLLFST
ncbi:two-component system response regulator [filamentous cyanobacterium CCP2]|nr:two-component system response regulator [filamentous cyanobacterium CCP2]